MAKNAVTEWDIAPSNNADIAGINIAEGCPAGGLNDAIRTIMAQVASWLTSTAGPLLKSGGAMAGNVDMSGNAVYNMHSGSSVKDGAGIGRPIGYRNLPLASKSAAYTLALSDVGQGVATNANVTVPPNSSVAFGIGDTVCLYNNSGSAVTITQGAGVTLRLVGTATTGNRTLAQRGLCTLLKVATDEWIATGGGLS